MLVISQDNDRLLSTILAYLGPAVRDCLSALLVSKAWYTALVVGDPWTHILRRLYPSCMSLLTGGIPSRPQPMPPASPSSSSSSPRHGATSATTAASTTDPRAKIKPRPTAKELLRVRLLCTNFTINQVREEERLAEIFQGKQLIYTPPTASPLRWGWALRPLVDPMHCCLRKN